MVNYSCDRCDFVTTKKIDLTRHLNTPKHIKKETEYLKNEEKKNRVEETNIQADKIRHAQNEITQLKIIIAQLNEKCDKKDKFIHEILRDTLTYFSQTRDEKDKLFDLVRSAIDIIKQQVSVVVQSNQMTQFFFTSFVKKNSRMQRL